MEAWQQNKENALNLETLFKKLLPIWFFISFW